MTTGRSLIGRRAREWGLGALLITLAVDVFVVAPLAQGGTSHVVQPVVHSIVLVSGIVIAFRSRGIVRIIVGVLVVAGLVTHWTYHDHPTVELGRADTALSLTFTAIITALILLEVFRAGPITLYRIRPAYDDFAIPSLPSTVIGPPLGAPTPGARLTAARNLCES